LLISHLKLDFAGTIFQQMHAHRASFMPNSGRHISTSRGPICAGPCDTT